MSSTPFDEAYERAVQRCIENVRNDKPKVQTARALRHWRRRWKNTEYQLFYLNKPIDWKVLCAALDRMEEFQ